MMQHHYIRVLEPGRMPSATHVIQMLSFSEQRDDDIGSAQGINRHQNVS